MAGKENPVRNSGAVGGGSAPAVEKVEAAEPEEELKADCESGGMMPCSGGHLLTVEEVKASRLSGGLKVCSASQFAAEKTNKEKETAAKRKAEDSKVAATGGSSEDSKAGDGEEEDSEIKWVEMPKGHMRWILAQKREKHIVPPIEDYMTEYDMNSTVLSQKNIDETRKLFTRLHASLQASHDDFFEYQAWVRQEYLQYGRVLIPESCSKDELQKEINDVWAQFKEEYKRDHPDDSDTESEEDYAMVADYSVKEHVSSN